jgi:hypothetical protein
MPGRGILKLESSPIRRRHMRTMRNILLFQGDCAACSKVARMVNDISHPDLETRSIDSPEVAEILAAVGFQAWPDRPSLLVVDDDKVEIRAGWAMRRRLARLIGGRRAATLTRLYLAEWEARISRTLDPVRTSRRRIIRGALAGVGGLILLPGTASAAARSAKATSEMRLANEADVERALALAPIRTAVQTWGPVQSRVYQIGSGGERILALAHGKGDIVTFVKNFSAASVTPTTLSMGIAPTKNPALRLYQVNGAALVDVTQIGTAVKVTAVREPGVEPDITPTECFVACIIAFSGEGCVANCLGCITGGFFTALVDCPQCVICAGRNFTTCKELCGI